LADRGAKAAIITRRLKVISQRQLAADLAARLVLHCFGLWPGDVVKCSG